MTARLITITNEQGIPESLKSIISMQIVDNKVEAIVVKSDNDYIRITKNDGYSSTLKVMTEQPKIEVSKWKLHGKFAGLVEVEEMFDSEYEATNRKSEYFNSLNHYSEDGLVITEVKVLVDEVKI